MFALGGTNGPESQQPLQPTSFSCGFNRLLLPWLPLPLLLRIHAFISTQAAAKLILLSAFVQAHTTAQELIQKHLAQLGGEMSDDESVSAAAKGRFVGPGMLAEDAGAVTVRDAGSDNGACLQQQRKSVEQQGEVQAARIALQESQAEVAAALAFAKEVGTERCGMTTWRGYCTFWHSRTHACLPCHLLGMSAPPSPIPVSVQVCQRQCTCGFPGSILYSVCLVFPAAGPLNHIRMHCSGI